MVRIAEKPAKKISHLPAHSDGVSRIVEQIVGCKWSLLILTQICGGTNRPGAIVKSHPKLTTKVMNERLNKMVRFGILYKIAYPQIPPRVEYHLTDFGLRFVGILDSIERLQADLSAGRIAIDE